MTKNEKTQPAIEKITYIESQVQNIKSILKEQTTNIEQYHKSLKEISSQLKSIKEKLTK